jgi:iron complex transport system substrate-binding protein
MAEIPVFGRPGQADFSVEKAIALKPSVLILNLDAYGPSRETVIPQLDQAGIPVVVVDFRQYPLENTVPSVLIMGKLFGREARAQELVDFYIQHINMVYEKVEEIEQRLEPKPLAFIYRAARFGADCCNTFGRGNMGLFVERAGGRNMGSDVIPGWSGTVNPEAVLAADPDLIIVTGSNWTHSASFEGFPYVTFGYDALPEQSRAQLKAGIELTPGWSHLKANENGRVYGIWHQFYNSPYSFYASVCQMVVP